FLMVPVLNSLTARRSDACDLRLLLRATFLLFIRGAGARRLYYRFFSLTPPLLMSTSVRTAPSILLSAVRYGRVRSEKRRAFFSPIPRSPTPWVFSTSC